MIKLTEEQTRDMKTGLVVGIPFCGRPVTPEWAMCMACQNYPINTTVRYSTVKKKEVGEARNFIVEDALKVGAKWIWFVDDDTAPPTFAVRHLIYQMQQQGPDSKVRVIGGIYCQKTDTCDPVVFTQSSMGAHWHWKVGDVFKCTGIGTGCMLIDTRIFAEIEKPYFLTVDEEIDGQMMGEIEGKISSYKINDDLYFCKKVIDAGYEIMAHGGVLCIHWDVETGKHYVLPEDSYPNRPREEGGKVMKLSSTVGT